MTALLELNDIRRSYPSGDGPVEVLKGISLRVEAGEMVAIVGASGSGKSTLMNILGCLDKPTSGTYRVAGTDVSTLDGDALAKLRREHFGFIFQRYHLLSHLSAAQNVEVPAVYAGVERKKRLERAKALLTRLGLAERVDYQPSQLSGGQRQRVAIARALVNEPRVLLLDEPLASLDIPRKRELLPYLQRLTREINIPMLYVSHSLDEILHLADRVMVLENGQVKAFGVLEEVWGSSVMNPWLPKEQQSSILKVTVLEHHPHYAMTALALGDQHLWVNKLDEPLQAALRIRIQATDVSLVLQPPQQTSIRNVLRAKVVNSYDDNGQVEVELEVGGKTLWARISPWARDELAIKPGLWLYAQIKSVSITA